MADRRVPLLLITGPMGVGKSTVATEVSDRLAGAGVGHAVVDLDELARSHPPGDADLAFRNLACVWESYAAAGVPRLIVAWTLQTAPQLERESLEDFVVETEGRSIEDVAAEVVRGVGWTADRP